MAHNPIMQELCDFFKIKENEIKSDRRNQAVALPRQTGYWLYRELTDYSYPRISRAFNRIDHSTIIHGCKNVDAWIKSNNERGRKALQLKAIVERKLSEEADLNQMEMTI